MKAGGGSTLLRHHVSWLVWLACSSHAAEAVPGTPRDTPPDTTARRILLDCVRAARENSLRPPAPRGVFPPRSPRGDGGAFPPRPPGGDGGAFQRREGDGLSDELVRTAARAARAEVERGTDPREAARAFLLALGGVLDPPAPGPEPRSPGISTVWAWWEGLETAEERRSRQELVRGATLAGRTDLLLHFALGAALAGELGPAPARAASLQKEVADAMKKDAGRGSGFSFVDLAVSEAGIALAEALLEAAKSREALAGALEALGAGFRGKTLVPGGLEEGSGWKEVQARYGSVSDPRFTALLSDLRAEARRRAREQVERRAPENQPPRKK